MRVAAIDIGTNSVRLLVADVREATLAEVDRRLTITRLGEGVDAARTLAAEPVRRTMEAVAAYGAAARRHGARAGLVAATSAVRDARDGDAFLARAGDAAGLPSRLLTGEEEARLTFLGVTSGRPPLAARTAVVDVGGGSTEVTVGRGRTVEGAVSVDAGAVRATERLLGEGVVPPDRLAAGRAAVDRTLRDAVPAALRDGVEAGIAVAGTATTLAALDLGLERYDAARIHGHRLARDAVEAWTGRLAALDAEGRAAVPGLEPGRAPVIVGGCIVLLAVLALLGLEEVEVSERDILHGIALLAAGVR